MRFTQGQQVMVLDTEGKPAGSATIKHYHPDTKRYTVDFKYANSEEAQEITLPEERLITSKDIGNNAKKEKLHP